MKRDGSFHLLIFFEFSSNQFCFEQFYNDFLNGLFYVFFLDQYPQIQIGTTYLERLEFFLLFLIESVESNQTKCFSMQISVEIEEAVVNSARRVALFNFVAGG